MKKSINIFFLKKSINIDNTKYICNKNTFHDKSNDTY